MTVYGTDEGNLLPELGDRGDQGQVGGVGRQHEGLVHATGVLDAALAVPGVVALGPGQLGLKTLRWTEAKDRINANPQEKTTLLMLAAKNAETRRGGGGV